MILREAKLSSGWYPRQRGQIEEFLEPAAKKAKSEGVFASAVLAPHAGWYYSGALAAQVVSLLDPRAETVAVIGGHLPASMPILSASEDAVKTPLGLLEIDRELRNEFESRLSCRPDNYDDNTVEVLLPMLHYFFPKVKLLWLRFPAHINSFEAGKVLKKSAEALGRRTAVIISTDLTHYGANYGFAPKGSGKSALDWVKNVNDAAFIEAVLAGDPFLVLKRADKDFSSCSAGAVLGGLGFVDAAGETPVKTGKKLLAYGTSADVTGEETPASFVGYASILLG